jgi:tetratricopeptide (TPR) repeat protein
MRNTDDNVWLEHRMPREMVRAHVENVGIELMKAAANGRLAALESMMPGSGMAALAHEMVFYPHRGEPLPMGAKYFSEPWRDIRKIQLGGLQAELEARGRKDLAHSVQQWDLRGQAYGDGRAKVARELTTQVRATGRLPGREVVQRLLREAPDLPMALSSMGGVCESEGDLDGAAVFWKRVLDHPRSGAYYDALLGLGRIARARKNFEEAGRWAEQPLTRNLYINSAYLALANLDIERGDSAAARKRLTAGLRFNPHDREIEALLAQLTPPAYPARVDPSR